MGTTLLRKFLQSLCCNSCWKYALFWKLQHQSQMLLTCEDGYCHIPQQGDFMESILDNTCFEGLDEISSSNWESSTYNESSGGNTVGAAVAYMSSRQYAFGDGVVGEVAYTGNYRWVFSESISSGNTKLVSECQDEWLFQFSAGIKTILLVPVVPYGVLQLGSLETVVEDPAMVAYIKNEFVGHQNFVEYSESFPVDNGFLAQSSSLLISALMENLDELSALATNKMKSEDSMAVNNVIQPNENEIIAACKTGDSAQLSGIDMQKFSNSSRADDVSAYLSMIEVPEPFRQSLDFSQLGMIESSIYSCLEEELPAFSYSSNSNMEVFGEYVNKLVESERLKQESVDKETDSNCHRNVGPFLSFPSDSELHKALLPAFVGKTNDSILGSSVSGEDVYNSSNVICSGDLCVNELLTRETDGRLVNGDDERHPLEPPVVAHIQLGKNSSSKENEENSSTISSREFASFAKGQVQSERSALGGNSTVLRDHMTSAFGCKRSNIIASSLPSATSSESVISEIIEEEVKNRYGYLHQGKSSKLSGASKRKGKPGDKQKPRPRDRQLIQDRLKELRELVPNGSKCSIDGLLDRTITHMQFLRSVSDRADKLRQWVHPEGGGRKNMKSPEQKGGSPNGTSWAIELGSDQEICPIIVEDLEYPGHMIIEMICEENSRFLEIAEVIHGLELTILKGLMETHSGNTWAHFVIEAPRGLHRLDIFWPLMKILQQNRSPISSKI